MTSAKERGTIGALLTFRWGDTREPWNGGQAAAGSRTI